MDNPIPEHLRKPGCAITLRAVILTKREVAENSGDFPAVLKIIADRLTALERNFNAAVEDAGLIIKDRRTREILTEDVASAEIGALVVDTAPPSAK